MLQGWSGHAGATVCCVCHVIYLLCGQVQMYLQNVNDGSHKSAAAAGTRDESMVSGVTLDPPSDVDPSPSAAGLGAPAKQAAAQARVVLLSRGTAKQVHPLVLSIFYYLSRHHASQLGMCKLPLYRTSMVAITLGHVSQ